MPFYGEGPVKKEIQLQREEKIVYLTVGWVTTVTDIAVVGFGLRINPGRDLEYGLEKPLES
jgi:hypothetical protein